MDSASRVSRRIEDMAAVEYEHGRDLVADMMRVEAQRLRSDGLAMFLPPAKTTSDAMCSCEDECEHDPLEALRTKAAAKNNHKEATARVEELVAEAWLLEGHTYPA